MSRIVRCTVIAFLLMATGITAAAQVAGAQPAADRQQPPSGYTMEAHAREVVTDVTVTDRHGNPIHGIPQSSFRIFDNGRPQRLASFQEHTGADAAPLDASPANVYSNDIVLHPPSVFNVILLDTATLNIFDQMYLRQELDRFIRALPPTEPFAIFLRSSQHTIMLASFTADHRRLLQAVDQAVPRLRQPGARYMTEFSLLQEICTYLEQYPGRKNVLWFNGGSSLMLRPDPNTLAGYQDLRPLYDQLERSRIALYPIDARGLLVAFPPYLAGQHLLMEDEAEATGGRAVINTNGLADAAEHIAATGASFYTLTYSPRDVKVDNRWHRVRVSLEGGEYRLSYRRGYYDDGYNLKQTDAPGRRRLLRNGEAAPGLRLQPILFQVSVAPADTTLPAARAVIRSSPGPPRKGERAYSLHYSVPLDAFPRTSTAGRNDISLGLGLLAFDQQGRPTARIADKVTLSVSEEHLDDAAPGARLGFDQQINLPDGEDFLYVAVWSPQSGRVGVVQIPLAVEKARLR